MYIMRMYVLVDRSHRFVNCLFLGQGQTQEFIFFLEWGGGRKFCQEKNVHEAREKK